MSFETSDRQLLEVQAALVRASGDAIITMDSERRILAWNQGAQKIYGWPEEQAIGRVIHHFLRTESPDSIEMMDRQLEANGRWEGQLRHKRQDGKTVIVDSQQVRLQVTGPGPAILEINRDITGRLELEEQLRQAQRMESVGRLAGGVAHDFNNHLTIVLGFAMLLLGEKELRPEWRGSIEEIVSAAQRASLVTKQLLMFSRQQPAVQSNVAINDSIRGMETMLRRLMGEAIELSLNLAPVSPLVRINDGYLEQILMNLLINARDAVPANGKIHVETGTIHVDREYTSNHLGLMEGVYGMVSVSDNGSGMTPEIRSRIFEPFFTTKDSGKGTGLGLSMVYGMVQQAKGSVLVYSEPGKGSTFKVLLPLSPQSAEVADGDDTDSCPTGAETILVAEDEDGLRHLISRILTRHGYQIITAVNGRDALDKIMRHLGSIDLVLTDVVMPEIGGAEVGRRLRELAPHIPFLYMSGYTAQIVDMDDKSLIHKPFTPAQLLQRIRAALREASASVRSLKV